MSIRVITGDCLEVMSGMESNSVDAIVTDPPYHLTTGKKGGSGPASVNLDSPHGRARVTTGFMGMKWDGGDIAQRVEVWTEALRVLKPGGHMLSFGGTRTYHRMVCAIEDAGFEIRDTLAFLHGVGFPKSLCVSKAIDKAAGAERKLTRVGTVQRDGYGDDWDTGSSETRPRFDEPATDAARQWQGWGTALKPAMEMICLARKPFPNGYTVAQNVLEFGTGGLNIDACRVDIDPCERDALDNRSGAGFGTGNTVGVHQGREEGVFKSHALGRWPSHLVHDGSDEVLAAFPQTQTNANTSGAGSYDGTSETTYGKFPPRPARGQPTERGSAARFFHNTREGESRVFYTAKASSFDRNDGTYDLPQAIVNITEGHGRGSINTSKGDGTGERVNRPRGNHHATVKSTELMRWLCRLITPPGGLILDPFCGSGSTLKAAEIEGFSAIGIELDPAFCEIARRRIASDMPLFAEIAALTEEALSNSASETLWCSPHCVPAQVLQFDLFADA